MFGLGNRLLGVKLISREQNCRWSLTQAKTSGVKTGSTLVCRPCDSTSGNLNKTSARERSRGVYVLSFAQLFDDISLVLNVRRLCVVVDSLINAAKVCDCVSSAWSWQAQLRYVVEWLSCCTKIFLACSRLRDSRVRWIEKVRIWKKKTEAFSRPAPLFAYL